MPGSFGTSNDDDGATASTGSSAKSGVFGFNQDSENPAISPGGNGVFGLSLVSNGAGVFGANNGGGIGVLGESKDGDAIVGATQSPARSGIFARNDSKDQAQGALGGNGVLGLSQVPNANGVFGTNTNGGTGVRGESATGDAIVGATQSSAKSGVFGINNDTSPVPQGVPGGSGVFGLSLVPNGSGVFGANNGGGNGVTGISNQGPGVFGQGVKDAGVTGFHGDPRLQETTVASDGAKAGLFGASDIGGGVLGYSRSPQSFGVIAFGGVRASAINHPFAGEFNGAVQVNGDLTVTGDVFLPGADCSEHFDVAGLGAVEPGSVVVIGEGGELSQSQTAYDKKVAGVISGAGAYRAGIILDKRQAQDNRLPVALVGKVYCKVDAQYSPIDVGDMLTSSPTPGHAMKATDPIRAFGTVIGKALSPWREGRGLIPILVSLQ